MNKSISRTLKSGKASLSFPIHPSRFPKLPASLPVIYHKGFHMTRIYKRASNTIVLKPRGGSLKWYLGYNIMKQTIIPTWRISWQFQTVVSNPLESISQPWVQNKKTLKTSLRRTTMGSSRQSTRKILVEVS